MNIEGQPPQDEMDEEFSDILTDQKKEGEDKLEDSPQDKSEQPTEERPSTSDAARNDDSADENEVYDDDNSRERPGDQRRQHFYHGGGGKSQLRMGLDVFKAKYFSRCSREQKQTLAYEAILLFQCTAENALFFTAKQFLLHKLIRNCCWGTPREFKRPGADLDTIRDLLRTPPVEREIEEENPDYDAIVADEAAAAAQAERFARKNALMEVAWAVTHGGRTAVSLLCNHANIRIKCRSCEGDFIEPFVFLKHKSHFCRIKYRQLLKETTYIGELDFQLPEIVHTPPPDQDSFVDEALRIVGKFAGHNDDEIEDGSHTSPHSDDEDDEDAKNRPKLTTEEMVKVAAERYRAIPITDAHAQAGSSLRVGTRVLEYDITLKKWWPNCTIHNKHYTGTQVVPALRYKGGSIWRKRKAINVFVYKDQL